MRTAGAFLASARSLRVANTAAEISTATSPILNGLFISFDSHFDRQTLGTRGLTRRPVLAANGLPHERTKSIAPQLLASVGAAQRPRPWLLCDSKPRLVGGRSLPCSATCIFNWRWRLLIPSLVGAQERLSVAPLGGQTTRRLRPTKRGRRPKPTPCRSANKCRYLPAK